MFGLLAGDAAAYQKTRHRENSMYYDVHASIGHVLDRIDKGGLKATYLDPAAMRAEIDTESRYFADIIKRGNVKVN